MGRIRKSPYAKRITQPLARGWNLVGPMLWKNGIGHAARTNISAMQRLRAGIPMDIEVPSALCEDTYLHINPKKSFIDKFATDGQVIGFWAWETSQCPDEWVPLSQRYSQIWVPSRFVADSLRRAGVEKTIEVVPHAIFPSKVERVESEGIRFLIQFDGHSRVSRKLPHIALAGIIAACKKTRTSASITLKCHNHDDWQWLINEAVSMAGGLPGYITINVNSQWVDSMDAIWASHDVFVTACRAEGFGLPLVEAMLNGVLVVSPFYGAATDYLTQENAFPVECSLCDAASCGDSFFTTGKWADPRIFDISEGVIAAIREHKTQAWINRVNEAKTMAKNFSFENLLCTMHDLL